MSCRLIASVGFIAVINLCSPISAQDIDSNYLIENKLGKFRPILFGEAVDSGTRGRIRLPFVQPVGKELPACGIHALVSKQAACDVGR